MNLENIMLSERSQSQSPHDSIYDSIHMKVQNSSLYRAESRLVVVWGQRGWEWGWSAEWQLKGTGCLWRWWKCPKIDSDDDWLYLSVNILKFFELHTLNGWISFYVNYISVKLFFKNIEDTLWSCFSSPAHTHLEPRILVNLELIIIIYN